MPSKNEIPVRQFSLSLKNHKTTVVMGEFKNGDIGVQLITKGNKKKDRVTTIRLKRETFNMLGVAMCAASNGEWDVTANAAHNPQPEAERSVAFGCRS